MFFNAKNRSIDTGKYIIDYFTFGKGDNIIVILPGIYGFTAITPKAISLVFQFRQLANDFSIYYFKRRRRLPYQHTIDEMADDQNEVMNILDIKNANMLGLSMGGMIAQAVAIKYPDKVKRLVLGVTTSYPNEKMKNILNNWIKIAKDSNYKELIMDMVVKIYTEEYLRKMRRYY
ncbi:MAG: alpha/beta hydrolase, partial [Candidatus Hydromicrobium sp.]